MGNPNLGDVPSTPGAGMLLMREVMVEMVGAASMKRAVATLPPDVALEYEQLSALSWVPLTTLAALIDAVAREAGREPESFFDQVVKKTTERSFKTLFRVLLHFTTDHALISRTPIIYAKTRNVGKLEAKVVQPGVARLTLTGWPSLSERNARSIAIGIETVLTLSGRAGVRWTWMRTGDGAQFELRWASR
jgi:hypothetical protein